MVLIQVYTKCIKTKYKARLLSKGTLVFVIMSALSLVLPFILAYKSKGFWIKRDIFYDFPDVRFQGKYIFVAMTNNKSFPIVCSSYPVLMKHFENFSSCSQIKVRELDYNNDKIIDEFFLELKVNLPENEEIVFFTMILPIHLKLHIPSCPLEMQSEIILQKQMRMKVSNLTLIGNVKIEQTYPLQCSSKRINTFFNYSSLRDEYILEDYKLDNMLNQKKKNLTLTVSNILAVQESKNKNSFILNMKIRYFEQQFYYEPQFLQILKWAWMQYYVIYIIIQFIINKILNYIFENRLVLYYKMKLNKND